MKYRTDIYIGELIKQKCKEQGISKTQLAEKIRHSRSGVYKMFDKKSIDIDVLIRLSELLNHPFLEEYMPKRITKTGTRVVLEIEVKDGETCVRHIEE